MLVVGALLIVLVAAQARATTLVVGSDGNSYGTASTGGSYGVGTIFCVTPGGATTVVYDFTGGSDGGAPEDALVAGGDGTLYGTTRTGGTHGVGTAFQVTTTGALTTLFGLGSAGGTGTVAGIVRGSDARLYGTTDGGASDTVFRRLSHPGYFDGQKALNGGVYYLTLPSNNVFGYYTFLADANYLYHFDLGFEYIFDAADGHDGVYFYDFTSNGFFYTSPTFPFPYLYDFSLQAFLYYYPDPTNPQRYNTNGVRYFYNFATRQIITK